MLAPQIDLGPELGVRTVASGLRGQYRSGEELVGRLVLVVCNLKDRVMVSYSDTLSLSLSLALCRLIYVCAVQLNVCFKLLFVSVLRWDLNLRGWCSALPMQITPSSVS